MSDDDDFLQDEMDESLSDIDDDSCYSEPTQDFSSDRPLDFSREQMNVISSIHKKFADLSANSLSEKLSLTVIIGVDSVYELTMEEFSRFTPSPTVLGVVNMTPLNGNAIMEIKPAISSAIINRLSRGKTESSESRFELTDNGKKIMEGIYAGLLKNLSEAWSAVTKLRPQLDRIETNPSSIYLPEEKVVMVELEVDILDPEMEEDMEDVEGIINLCIPCKVIGQIVGKPIIGKLILEDGSFYEGDFIRDKFNGKGKMTLGHSLVYEGDFLDGKQTGKGKLIYPDGGFYEGDFLDSKKHGKGKLIFGDGEVYEGDFLDDQKHGKGKYTWADGDVYEGDFACDNFHGKGKKTYANGGTDEGDYVEDNLNGKGKQTFADGSVYEGDFIDGKQHGKGKRTYANGDVYEGDWEEGNFQGKGKYTYSDGNVYEGDFVEGNMHGKGKFTYADGTYDEGDFVEGNLHGKGKRKFTNGIYEGEFIDDEQTKGRMNYTDGSVYEGNYAKGKKNGKGKMTYPDGKVEEGKWKDGEFVQ